ncbi:hypothetical protein EDB19DRAFT_1915217 [Suillus lakei]|nr:hypothetical protein EDB19DRAFT_1915217 [Suillus lakei]
MSMNVGPAPKMGRLYVEIPPAPPTIAGNDAANPTVWSPSCGPCIHRGLVCRQGFNNSVHVSPETDDTATPAAASTSGAPAPVVAELLSAIATPTPTPTPTPATAPITTPTPAPTPTTAAASSPDGPADASVDALKEQIEASQLTVTSLEAKASIGEKHPLGANRGLANRGVTSKLLAEQFQELHWQLLPPQVPASPVMVCLPVMIGNSGNKDIAGAEDAAESTSGTIAEAEGAAESMSGTMAEAEEATESASGVIASLSSNTMDVAKDPAESASTSGVISSLSGNTKDVAEAEDAAESASIASSVQE